MRTLTSLFLLLTALCLFVEATHFRYGTITWYPTVGNYRRMNFNVALAFRRSYGSWTGVNVGGTIVPGTLNFGDGTSENINLAITSIDATADWCSGTYSTAHAYSKNGTFLTYHADCCRISSLNNDHDANWRVSTNVNVGGFSGKLNTSPVSTLLPIIAVKMDYINKFTVPVNDVDGDTISFSLATPAEQGDNAETQPPNFSVNAVSGLVTFDTHGVATGLWTAQIKISDGKGFIVVDFILDNSLKDIYVCAPSCSNGGQICTKNSSCSGCASNLVPKCVITTPPYFVIPPTPALNSIVNMQPNVASVINITSKSDTPSATITLIPNGIPVGATLSSQVGLNPTYSLLSWTPTLNDVGSYVVALGLRDSNGNQLSYGVHTFTIVVAKPICGFGTINNAPCTVNTCTCSCQTGYDPASRCYYCSATYYGPNCTKCPNCNNGFCNDGSAGDGTCVCFNGWSGPACDNPIPNPCNPQTPSNILSTITGSNIITPQVSVTYIGYQASFPALSVPLSVNVPAKPTLDILLLVENSKTVSQSQLNSLGSYALNFASSISTNYTSPFFGVASFTNLPNIAGTSSQDYLFLLNSALSGDPRDMKNALGALKPPTFGAASGTASCQLNSLYAAGSSTNVGWRSTSFKIVLLITGSNYAEGGSYTTKALVKSALVGGNVVPVMLTTTVNPYNTLVTSIGFGAVGTATLDSAWANWVNLAVSGIQKVTSTLHMETVQDTRGFVSGLSADKTAASSGGAYSLAVSLLYPQSQLGLITEQPQIIVAVMGYGTATVTVLVNRKPYILPVSVVLDQNKNLAFTLDSVDPDANAMTIIFDDVPSNGIGTLYLSQGGQAITVGSSYSVGNVGTSGKFPVFFQTYPNKFGTTSVSYHVQDGCLVSLVANASITVNFVNQAPTCNPFSVSTNEDVALTFELNGDNQDPDTPLSSLVAYVVSLPPSSCGVLKQSNNGATISAGGQVLNNRLVTFTPALHAFGTCTFLYKINDGFLDSASALVTINIIQVNQQPTASAVSPININRGVTTPVVLTGGDIDYPQTFSFIVNSFSSGNNGKWTIMNGAVQNDFTSYTTPFPVAWGIANQPSLSTTISPSFTSPVTAQGVNYAFLTFVVNDGNLSSTPATVSINIIPNTPPTTNPAGPINVLEDQSSSSAFSISGSDVDPIDANSLSVVVTSLPTKGKLFLGTTQVTLNMVVSTSSIASLTFVPTPLNNGNDQFTFVVKDTLLAVSNPAQTVAIVITHVNHPPVGSVSTITTNQNTAITFPVYCTDPDNDPVLTGFIKTLPANGTLTQFNGAPITAGAAITDASYRLVYTPPTNKYGMPTFTSFQFYCNDNQNKNNISATVTATIGVVQVDQAPVATPGYKLLAEDTTSTATLTITLDGTDVDNTTQQLTAYLVTLPSSSLLSLVSVSNQTPLTVNSPIPYPRSILISLPLYHFGVTSFKFYLSDGIKVSNTVTYTINVTHVEHTPVCSVVPFSPITVQKSTTTDIQLKITDPDMSDTFSFTINSVAATGTYYSDAAGQTALGSLPQQIATGLTNSNGVITKTISVAIDAAASGTNFTYFSFQVSDGIQSSTCTVSINVPAGSPPVANPAGPYSQPQDTTVGPIPLNGTDADPGDGPLLYVLIISVPLKGKLYTDAGLSSLITANQMIMQNATTVYYSPNSLYRGTDSFTFSVVDPNGFVADPQTVSLTMTVVNHQPTAFYLGTVDGTEGQSVDITGIRGSDIDGDSPLHAFITVLPTQGTLYQVDGVTQISVANTEITDPNFVVIFVPTAQLNGQPLTFFEFQIDDGTGFPNSRSSSVSVNINVAAVNDPPVATDGSININQDEPVVASRTITLAGTDVDNTDSELSGIFVSLPDANICLLVDGSGTAISTGVPYAFPRNAVVSLVAHAIGTTSFTFQLSDGSLTSNVATFTINVLPVAHDPTADALSPVTATRTIPVYMQLNAADIDMPESFDMVITSFTDGGGQFLASDNVTAWANTGSFKACTGLVNTASGVSCTVVYTPPATAATSIDYAHFTFVARDSTGRDSAPVTVSVNIVPNTPPTANPAGPLSMPQDTLSAQVSMTGDDIDVADQGHLRIQITVLPTKGVLRQLDNTNNWVDITVANTILSPGNSIVYMPNIQVKGGDTYTFVVLDLLDASSAPEGVDILVVPGNAQPIASPGTFNGLEDQFLNFTLAGSDDDGNTLTAIVSSLPAKGTLYQADCVTKITSVPATVLDSNFKLCFLSDLHDSGDPYTTFNFYVNDNQGRPNSDSAAVTNTIKILNIDYPPVANDLNATTMENAGIMLTLPATDFDSPSIDAVVLSLPDPTTGTLYLADKTTALTVDVKIGTARQLWYVPPQDKSNKDLDDPNSPFARFTFTAANALRSSSSATVQIWVTHVPQPPKFVSDQYVTTPENTELPIILRAVSQNDLPVTVTITTAIPADKGLLYETVCDASDSTKCSTFQINANTIPYVVKDTDRYLVRYKPPMYENGDHFTKFYLQTGDGLATSQPFFVDISITPVDQAPVLVPYGWTRDIDLRENGHVVVRWNTSDIDSPLAKIKSKVIAYPSKGTLHRYIADPFNAANPLGYIVGEKLIPDADGVVEITSRDSDPSWLFYTIYVPPPNTFGRKLTSMIMLAEDEFELQSTKVLAMFNVKPVNQPPSIDCSPRKYKTNTAKAASLTNITIYDVDAGFIPISVNLTIGRWDGASISSATLTLRTQNLKNGTCFVTEHKNEWTINCTLPIKKLNTLLRGMGFSSTQSGEYYIRIDVDDMGDGADPDERWFNHLYAHDMLNVTVGVVAGDTGVVPVDDGNTMTIIIGTTSGAAALGAAGLFYYLKKRRAPTNTFWGESNPFDSDAVFTSPIFEQSQKDHFSPLYQDADSDAPKLDNDNGPRVGY